MKFIIKINHVVFSQENHNKRSSEVETCSLFYSCLGERLSDAGGKPNQTRNYEASASARCITLTGSLFLEINPSRCIKHPISVEII